jgi:hypothetical protein
MSKTLEEKDQSLAFHWQRQVPRVGCSNASCDSRITNYLRPDAAGSLIASSYTEPSVEDCLSFAEVCLVLVSNFNATSAGITAR